MRNTTNWAIPVPSSNADPDAVPTHLGNAIDAVDALIAACKDGTLASRPAAGNPNTYYMVSSGPSIGTLFWDNGSIWLQVTPTAGVVSDVTTAGFGDAPVIGVKPGFAPSDHRHGMPANPVTAHVAASNPHPQYPLAASMGPYSETLVVLGFLGASRAIDLSRGNAFAGTLNANCTLSIINAPTSATPIRTSFSIELLQDSTGGRVVTWPTSFDWGTAGPPTLSSPAHADFISGYSDDGTSGPWRVFYGGQGGY